jgi:uncharacterized protein (DUF1778 family)
MTNARDLRSERVDLQMTPDTRRTLERAATASNKSLAEYLVDTGLDAANDSLTEQRVFRLDEKRWDDFIAALGAPPQDNPKLRKLLARKPAWQK